MRATTTMADWIDYGDLVSLNFANEDTDVIGAPKKLWVRNVLIRQNNDG